MPTQRSEPVIAPDEQPFLALFRAAVARYERGFRADPNAAADGLAPPTITARREPDALMLDVNPGPATRADRAVRAMVCATAAAAGALQIAAVTFAPDLLLSPVLLAMPWMIVIGLLIWYAQLRMERVSIAVAPGSLTVRTRALFWSNGDRYRREDLARVAVGLSPLTVRDAAPVFELRIQCRRDGLRPIFSSGDGKPGYAYLEGRPRAELEWLAATIRREMGLVDVKSYGLTTVV